MSPPSPHNVLSIVGSGGLGKTTLAKHVFNKIINQFDCTTFVCVSKNYNVEKVLTDVLLQFSKSDSFFTQDQNKETVRMQEAFHMGKLYGLLQKMIYCSLFKTSLRRARTATTPQLIVSINQGSHFLLTEAVKK